MDILLGNFADAHLVTLTDSELADYERLLETADAEVLAWLLGSTAVPADRDSEVLRKLMRFHARSGPSAP